MSAIFVRPNLPDGKLPSQDWDYDGVADYANWSDWGTSDIVDALVLQLNWAVLFGHVNGRLNGTDIDTGSAAISEASYIADWDGTNEWPTRGHRHSHDGVDSAPLASGIIGASLLGTAYRGAIISPTIDYHGLLLYGSTVHDGGVVEGETRHFIAVPYDYLRWAAVDEQLLYRTTSGSCRFVGCLLDGDYANWTKEEQESPSLPAVDPHGDPVEDVSFREYATGDTNLPSGWKIQWVCFAFA